MKFECDDARGTRAEQHARNPRETQTRMTRGTRAYSYFLLVVVVVVAVVVVVMISAKKGFALASPPPKPF